MKPSNWSLEIKSETDPGAQTGSLVSLFLLGSVSLDVHQRPRGNPASLDGQEVAQVPQAGLATPGQQCTGGTLNLTRSLKLNTAASPVSLGGLSILPTSNYPAPDSQQSLTPS